MENQNLKTNDALRYLKANYHLFAFIDSKKEAFFMKNHIIFVTGENKTLKIDEYDFLSLYSSLTFYIEDDNSEEFVDTKKDEEYYSWRQ